MAEKEEVNALNELLKGQYMGLHAYAHFIDKLTDASVKSLMQQIQQEIEQQTQRIAAQISQIGGTPVTSEGLLGAMQSYIASWRLSNRTDEIVTKALDGEQLGIEMAEKIVRGDLSPESLTFVRQILDQDRRHIDDLQRLLIQPVGG
ncbi:MAG: DUF2383 domain-containing protein [Sporolactobacillus sp.]